ncbi:hypothetical protein EES44_22625 [Streptomyces sp. ADI96-15]|nr:hypothetical protein EES44_22625 [Streptomyces sp. ADI96-15]
MAERLEDQFAARRRERAALVLSGHPDALGGKHHDTGAALAGEVRECPQILGTRGGRGRVQNPLVAERPVPSAGGGHSSLCGFEPDDVRKPRSPGVGEESVAEPCPPACLADRTAVGPVSFPPAGVLVAAELLQDQQYVAEGGRRVGRRPQSALVVGQSPGLAAVPVAQWRPVQDEVAGTLRLARDEAPPLALGAVVVLAEDDSGVVLPGIGEVEHGAVGRALDDVEARFAVDGDEAPLLGLLVGGGIPLADAAVRGSGIVEHLVTDRVADHVRRVVLSALHGCELPQLRARAVFGMVADDERPVRTRCGPGAEGLTCGGVDDLQLQFLRGHGHRGASSRRLVRRLGTGVARWLRLT